MGVPVVESISTYSTTSEPATHTINKPAGTVEGDLLLLTVYADRARAVTIPSGFTAVTGDVSAGTVGGGLAITLNISYKVAGASEPSSYDFSFDANEQAAAGMRRISGVDTANPIDVFGTDNTTATTTTLDCPSVTTTNDDALVIRDLGEGGGNDGIPFASPVGVTTDWDIDPPGFVNGGGAHESQATAGATGAATYSWSGSSHAAAATVAINAAAVSSITKTRTASLQAALAGEKTLVPSLDAALRAQTGVAANLQAALQVSGTSTAALGAVIGEVGTSPSRGLSSANQTAALDRVVRPVLFFELEIDDGSPTEFIRVSDAPYSITWSGHEWLGIGTLGSVSAAEETTELKAPGVEATLNGIDPSLASIALGRHIQGDPVTIYLGLLDEGHGLVDTPLVLFRGRADTMPIKLGQTASIRLTVESVLADWDRPRVRRYNNADQQQRFPGDRFFEFAEQTVDKDVIWPARTFFER